MLAEEVQRGTETRSSLEVMSADLSWLKTTVLVQKAQQQLLYLRYGHLAVAFYVHTSIYPSRISTGVEDIFDLLPSGEHQRSFTGQDFGSL